MVGRSDMGLHGMRSDALEGRALRSSQQSLGGKSALCALYRLQLLPNSYDTRHSRFSPCQNYTHTTAAKQEKIEVEKHVCLWRGGDCRVTFDVSDMAKNATSA